MISICMYLYIYIYIQNCVTLDSNNNIVKTIDIFSAIFRPIMYVILVIKKLVRPAQRSIKLKNFRAFPKHTCVSKKRFAEDADLFYHSNV